MKKLLLTMLLCFAATFTKAQLPAYDCTTRVYLDRWDIEHNFTIFFENGVRKASFPNSCIPFGPDPLIIKTDSANGIYPDRGAMKLTDYLALVFMDTTCARNEVFESYSYKDHFYFQTCGTPYPFEYRNGVIENVILNGWYGYNPDQYNTLIQYYTPDPNIALIPCIPDQDPFINGAIAIAVGHKDTYNGNKYDLTGLPDGTYVMKCETNLPPRVKDLDPSLHNPEFIVTIQGTSITFRHDITLPPAVKPNAPTGLTLQGQTRLSWNPVQGATSYEVYRAKASKGQGGWFVQSIEDYRLEQIVTSNSANLLNLSGKWGYRVKAVKCQSSDFSDQIIR